MTRQPADHIIACDRIYNLRDYGGLAVAGGGRLRRGLLLRSGEHGEASDDDLRKVSALELATVVDLRGLRERANHPCRRPPGFAATMIVTGGETADPARFGAAGARRNPFSALDSDAAARAAMKAAYASMPYSPIMVDLFVRYFAALAASPGASLIHCMAGKDRTGFAVRLFHALVGVHPDDAMADYLASNAMPGREDWIVRTKARYARDGMPLGDIAAEAVLAVDADYLAAALAEVAGRSGSVESYLRDVVGVSPGRAEAIRAAFIA